MFQLCKHGKQDGEPCEECTKVVRLQAKVESATTNNASTQYCPHYAQGQICAWGNIDARCPIGGPCTVQRT